ncbi:MAG: LPS-assembly protein LptD [Candidatus Omnitrophica bacterium]|nr:LPS-assembly protein LptD [Candidatus Omnitrophota bacterium]
MIRQLRFFILVAVPLFLIVFLSPSLRAETAPAADESKSDLMKSSGPVELKGDKVSFNNQENKFEAEGNVVVTRGDITIYADAMQFYRQEKVAIAQGNIIVETLKGTITGDKMTYNLESQTGNFTNAHISTDPFYGKGTIISKTGPQEINMQDGYLTTCDHDIPHYRLQAKNIKVEPGKQAQAKRVKVFVGPVPLMYLPRYTQSLADRHPRYSLTPGYSKNFGFYVLNAWRYDFNEKVNGVFHADFRDRKGGAVGADVNYRSSWGDGAIRTYYASEYNIGNAHIWDKGDIKATHRDRYKGEWFHHADPDDKTAVTFQYYRMSDADFLKDYFERENRNDPNPPSYFVLTRLLTYGTLGLTIQPRVNNFNTEVERLPELTYNLSNQALGSTGLFFKNTSSYVNLTKKFATPSSINLHTDRLDTQNEISYPMKIAFFELKPFVGGQHTFYSRTINKEDFNTVRGQFRTGADLSTKFSKVFDVQGKFLGMEVNRLRHIIAPSIAYLYAHEPSLEASKLDQFDAIDALERSHRITFALENKLQTKRNGMPVDLARLILETPFLLKEDPGQGGFGHVIAKMELSPTDWLRFSSDADYNAQAQHLESINYDMYLNGGKDSKWYLNFSERYSRDFDNQFTTELGYVINPIWRFKIYQQFDVESGINKEQQYALIRDMHEWEMEFNFNHTRGDGAQFMVIFRLKAFPELAVDASTGFNKRRAGQQ